jgi:hypothetical protein
MGTRQHVRTGDLRERLGCSFWCRFCWG